MSVMYGTPGMSFFKAKEYSMKSHGKHRITIPIRGNYKDLDPDFYSKEDGSFDIFNKNIVGITEETS